ncbi:uncharacterized protein JN550_003411 [Neoarthrinium moseri]|uniref:uncharacterized protein n=1 Tax=Neoarthrinium moseri TaxID=1658444 RepID=UPI001FDB8C65|nr:uncharacterized protein JN550_003411 [Neoarthrinium moseri]KAI1873158.1 hypothetical protein JN550_003411 [Neoarthrinium moseri]
MVPNQGLVTTELNEHRVFKPLPSVGVNTCYRNAALAALFNLPPFVHFLRQFEAKSPEVAGPNQKFVLLNTLCNTFWSSANDEARKPAVQGLWDHLCNTDDLGDDDGLAHSICGNSPRWVHQVAGEDIIHQDPTQFVAYLLGRLCGSGFDRNQVDDQGNQMEVMFRRLFRFHLAPRRAMMCECRRKRRRMAGQESVQGFVLELHVSRAKGDPKTVPLKDAFNLRLLNGIATDDCEDCGRKSLPAPTFHKLLYLPEVLCIAPSIGRSSDAIPVMDPDPDVHFVIPQFLDLSEVRDVNPGSQPPIADLPVPPTPAPSVGNTDTIYSLESIITLSSGDPDNKIAGHLVAYLRHREDQWVRLDDMMPNRIVTLSLADIEGSLSEKTRMLLYRRTRNVPANELQAARSAIWQERINSGRLDKVKIPESSPDMEPLLGLPYDVRSSIYGHLNTQDIISLWRRSPLTAADALEVEARRWVGPAINQLQAAPSTAFRSFIDSQRQYPWLYDAIRTGLDATAFDFSEGISITIPTMLRAYLLQYRNVAQGTPVPLTNLLDLSWGTQLPPPLLYALRRQRSSSIQWLLLMGANPHIRFTEFMMQGFLGGAIGAGRTFNGTITRTAFQPRVCLNRGVAHTSCRVENIHVDPIGAALEIDVSECDMRVAQDLAAVCLPLLVPRFFSPTSPGFWLCLDMMTSAPINPGGHLGGRDIVRRFQPELRRLLRRGELTTDVNHNLFTPQLRLLAFTGMHPLVMEILQRAAPGIERLDQPRQAQLIQSLYNTISMSRDLPVQPADSSNLVRWLGDAGYPPPKFIRRPIRLLNVDLDHLIPAPGGQFGGVDSLEIYDLLIQALFEAESIEQAAGRQAQFGRPPDAEDVGEVHRDAGSIIRYMVRYALRSNLAQVHQHLMAHHTAHITGPGHIDLLRLIIVEQLPRGVEDQIPLYRTVSEHFPLGRPVTEPNGTTWNNPLSFAASILASTTTVQESIDAARPVASLIYLDNMISPIPDPVHAALLNRLAAIDAGRNLAHQVQFHDADDGLRPMRPPQGLLRFGRNSGSSRVFDDHWLIVVLALLTRRQGLLPAYISRP